MEPISKLDRDIVRAICLELDPFKDWDDQPSNLQSLLDQLGLKDLYQEDPFKLTNLLLKTLHTTLDNNNPGIPIQ
jgi:hypothetical protein